MTRISSSATFFFKRIFPVLWFGFIIFILAVVISTKAVSQSPLVLIPPVFMAVIGFVLMKKLLWDLVDEVYDCGDGLLIRSNGLEETIPLSNIMNVSVATLVNPPRVTLRLVTSSRNFGNELVFTPKRRSTLNPFARLTAIDDLIVRVDQARAKRTT